MRFHWLEHVPFEDAAQIGIWALDHGYELTRTQLHAGQQLPEVERIDALAIMGGPMNVYQHRDYPWLLQEKRFIERAIGARIPVIGVCLGAQLIADVLGAKVMQNPQIEIGWFQLQLTDDASKSDIVRGMPKRFTAFHWHGDFFEIPSGAIHWARSQACHNQAFDYAGHVLGLQFHLEYSAQSIERMLFHCGNDLVEAPYVQNRGQIAAGLAHEPTTQELLSGLLDALLG